VDTVPVAEGWGEGRVLGHVGVKTGLGVNERRNLLQPKEQPSGLCIGNSNGPDPLSQPSE